MSGALIILMAGGRSVIKTVTIGDHPSVMAHGYTVLGSPYGAIAPNATFEGKTIVEVVAESADAGSTWSLRFTLQGAVTNDGTAFNSLTIVGNSTGSIGTFTRASASFSSTGGSGSDSTWTWTGFPNIPTDDDTWTITIR